MSVRKVLMAAANNGKGVIRMYGQITNTKDMPYDDKEETITPKKFKDALESLGDVSSVTIHLSSVGGDAYAGIAIHNAIKQAKAKTEIIVDGIAASAGSLIMCAGDKVTVNPSSIVMIHGGSIFGHGSFNAEDLVKMQQNVDAVNKSMIAIYAKRTGKTEAELEEMISAETWMVGQEIVDAGFADAVSDKDVPIEASLNISHGKKILTVNDEIELDISDVKTIPDILTKCQKKKCKAEDEAEKKKPFEDDEEDDESDDESDDEDKDEEKSMEDKCKKTKSKAELDVNAQIEAAIMAERKRIQEIDSISASIKDKQMLHDAKFNPEKMCDAKELAFRQLQAESKLGAKYLQDMQSDYEESNADGVPAASAEDLQKGNGQQASKVNLLMDAARNFKGE